MIEVATKDPFGAQKVSIKKGRCCHRVSHTNWYTPWKMINAHMRLEMRGACKNTGWRVNCSGDGSSVARATGESKETVKDPVGEVEFVVTVVPVELTPCT